MTRTLLLAICISLFSCHHVETKKTSSEVSSDVTNDRHEVDYNKEKAKTSTGKVKTVGPVETDEIDMADLYGWAPPAPNAPKGTPYTWRPVQHTEKKVNTKAAGSVTATNTNSDINKQGSSNVDTSSRNKSGSKSTGSSLVDNKFGLSWPVKLAIALGSVLAALGAVAFFKPAWLSLPARAFKWIVGLFRKKVTP